MPNDIPPWRRFYGDVPPSIPYPQTSLYQALEATVQRVPNLVAYEFLGATTTYRDFGDQIDRAAGALAAHGLSIGDRLIIALPPCPQAVIAFYAASSVGAVPVMVHPLSTAVEVERFATSSRSRLALTLDALYDRFTLGLAGPLDAVILTRISDLLPPLRRLGLWLRGGSAPRLAPDPRVRWWTELLAGSGPPAPRPAVDTNALSTILFSGGTTGEPKGIMLSHHNLISEGLQVAWWVNMREGDRVLAALPLFHGIGLNVLVNAPLMIGSRVILVPKFSTRTIVRLIRRSRPNFMAGVPSLYSALLRDRVFQRADLSCIKAAFSGGDSLPATVKRQFDQLLAGRGSAARLLEAYGLTETVSGVVAMPLQVEREGSVGIPLPDTLIQVCQAGTDQEVAVGETGEICIFGPSLMLGYLDDPSATAAALHRHADGRTWLHTGDLGRRDEDGFLYFLGRLKRMIKSSGFNVFPSQVEQVLCAHPAVAEAYVIGIPDEARGERVKAYVVLRTTYAATPALAEELIAHCRGQLIQWSCPREIEFRGQLPRTRIGKVDQRAFAPAPTPFVAKTE